MKRTQTIVAIMLSIVLFGCSNTAEKEMVSNESLNETSQTGQEVLPTQEHETTTPKINNEDGPPFSDSCICSFDFIAEFKYNDHRFDLILSGKGWNPDFWSCTYSFGELMSNEFPPDTTITDFRIHLVDLEKFESEVDSAIFESELIQNKLIATQRLWPGDEFTKCKFDPNKTGKYPKPKQWLE